MAGHWVTGNGGGACWVEYPDAPTPPPRYPTRGVPCGDGLRMHALKDRTGREINEFECENGISKRQAWMGVFMSPPSLMLALDKNPTEARAARRLAEFYAAQSTKR